MRNNCRFCGREIVCLPLAWGGTAAFEPVDWPTEEVPEKARYAFDRRRRAVVDLSGMPVHTLPGNCLMMHSCDQLGLVQSVGEVFERRPGDQ